MPSQPNNTDNNSSKVVELFSDRKNLGYQSTYKFSAQDLTNLSGDYDTVLKLCDIIDVLSLLEISCKKNGWKASTQISGCSLALLKVLLQLTRAEPSKTA